MSAYLIGGGALIVVALLALAPSWWQQIKADWVRANQILDTPAPPDELDAWLAMSPTHDDLLGEFFDAALGDEGRTA